MPKEKPNILVIWRDDIGITNLSRYREGLIGASFTIDHAAAKLHEFLAGR